MATKLNDNEHREAGANLFTYMRELLERDGDKASIPLHADHMRSLLATAAADRP
jgi:hypothetical protein